MDRTQAGGAGTKAKTTIGEGLTPARRSRNPSEVKDRKSLTTEGTEGTEENQNAFLCALCGLALPLLSFLSYA